MSSVPVPDAEETRANAAFGALLWALSRPGRPQTLPEPGEGAIAAALLDRECRVFCADPALAPLVTRTGACRAELAQADHAFLGAMQEAETLRALACGSALYPDAGATAVVRCTLGGGPRVRLTGPGVDGALELAVGGLPAGFWTTRAACLRYPAGFDLFLRDGAQVVGLPRSTDVEVI